MSMLGSLGENLTNTMKKLAGMSVIDKKVVKEVVKDIQRALIQSDVNIQLVLKLGRDPDCIGKRCTGSAALPLLCRGCADGRGNERKFLRENGYTSGVPE